MERYIAFDIGDRRIGVAVSDPFNSYALPSQTYVRTGFAADIAKLIALMAEKGATVAVCGLPVNVDGTPSEQTEKAERVIRALEERGVKVVRADERYTSVIAHEQLYASGKKAKEHRKYVDALAAAEILEGYLSQIKNKGEK